MSDVERDEQQQEFLLKRGASYPSAHIQVMNASSTVPSTKPRPKLQGLHVGDAKEADYETAWAAYKRIESQYSRTNRILADL